MSKLRPNDFPASVLAETIRLPLEYASNDYSNGPNARIEAPGWLGQRRNKLLIFGTIARARRNHGAQ